MGVHAIFPHGKFPRGFPRVCGFRQVLSVGLLSLPCSIGFSVEEKVPPMKQVSVSMHRQNSGRTKRQTHLWRHHWWKISFWPPLQFSECPATCRACPLVWWRLWKTVSWKTVSIDCFCRVEVAPQLNRSKRVLVSLVYFSNCTERSESVVVPLDWCSMLYIASRTNRYFVDIHLPLMHSIHLLRDLMLSAVNSYSSAWEAKSHNTNRPWSSNLIATPAQRREVDVYAIRLYCEYRQ